MTSSLAAATDIAPSRRLDRGPWTVVDKPGPAPGGDVRDYPSQAPYWWPSRTPPTGDPYGCPYVQRDGERNLEADTGTGRQDLEKVFDSSYDQQEGAAENNHGRFHDLLVAGPASATGDRDLVRRTVRDAAPRRVAAQIAADGSRPQELARTRSRHYSTFGLVAYVRPAAIGRHVGVDLWRYRGPPGRSLSRAVRHPLPAATGQVADAGDAGARKAVPRLEEPPGGDLWALRPAAEQLDSITG
ncbi:hypothetical protein QFZ75_000182 [Streptomyces sp. V3I8]|uniref:alginate lyase family protein n=1 Tax=Streptomyces sp. V3I8 TaxID=3042279 RepID=UPI002784EA08|nr:alginate lyase family protein [Streptomyces sp. V3I8]MDQ1033766.1 hypothetical protein [Streptomyces sp. V3I8]